MNYNHNHVLTYARGVVVPSYPFRVEMATKEKEERPYKKSSLLRELRNLTDANGKKWIYGAHMVHSGPYAGQLAILHANDDATESFATNLSENFAAYMYCSAWYEDQNFTPRDMET